MLKQAYDNGASDALARYKVAGGFLQTALSRGQKFLQGQAGALGELGQGLHGMLTPSVTQGVRAQAGGQSLRARMGASANAAQAAGRTQAWDAVKKLAPTGLGLGAAYLMTRGGDDQPQQPQQAPQYR